MSNPKRQAVIDKPCPICGTRYTTPKEAPAPICGSPSCIRTARLLGKPFVTPTRRPQVTTQPRGKRTPTKARKNQI